MTDWPPEGYGESQEWQKNERVIAIIAGVTGIAFFAVVHPWLRVFADLITGSTQLLTAMLGLSQSLIAWLVTATILLAVFIAIMIGLFLEVTTPIHERIHYEINRYYGLNPECTTQEVFFVESPGVVPVTTEITLRENTVSALGPFLVIGTVSGGLMLVTDGVVGAVFAFILLANSASSAGDLYNVWRFVWMPAGTLFANFREGDDEYRTEYAFPEND